ncbi:MAG: sigma-70 family RNA polymerase sigma factor [Clostridia bacterium]|nr:sigma-70 family RNA polymerase sigma factor [Clostridia bacterium]
MVERMNDAQRQLAEENIRLVGLMIGRLRLKYDFDDLHGVGSVGLCKAAASWRSDSGTAFSTYACHIIRNELINYLSKSSRRGDIRLLALDDCSGSLYTEEIGFEAVESGIIAKSLLEGLDRILDEDEAQMARLFLRGWDTVSVAKAFGLCPSSIVKARARIGKKLERWISDGGAGEAGE